MRFGIIGRFSPQRDATLGAIVDRARGRGHDVVVLDIARLIGGPVEFTPATGELTLGDVHVALDTLEALWLGPLPSASARLAPDDAVMSARDFDLLQKRQAARHALGWSIALCAEARGVPVLSSPSRARPFDHKPFQLAALHAAGLPVPATRIADHRGAAHADNDDDIIVKPVIGGPVERARVAAVTAGAPVIWQPFLKGPQARIVVIGGAIGGYTVAMDDGVLDARLLPAPRRDHLVDGGLTDLATRAAVVCNYDVCTVDFAIQQGTPVILEVNRTPQLLDVVGDDDHVIRACLQLIEHRGR